MRNPLASTALMKSIAFAAVPLLLLAGCVNHTWAPPPGGSMLSLDQQSAQCRLFARGITPSGGFIGASGSPAFVSGTMAGAALGHAVSVAVRTNENFNDCMFASGWIATDMQPKPVRAVVVAPATELAVTP